MGANQIRENREHLLSIIHLAHGVKCYIHDFQYLANLRGKWYYSSFFTDDEYKDREVNLPKVTQLVMMALDLGLSGSKTQNYFHYTNKQWKRRMFQLQKLRGKKGKSGSFLYLPSVADTGTVTCLPIMTLFWVSG